MKNFYFFIILALIQLVFNKTVVDWKLSIKDENGKSNIINLFPGIFTKVTLVLSNDNGEEVFDNSEKPVSFKLSLKNKNIVSLQNSFTLVPSESLVYTVYLGIKCGDTLSDPNSLFEIEKTEDDVSLTIGDVSIQVSNEKAKIDIAPLLNEISEQTYNLFRVNKEPYNIEDIKLVPKIQGENEDFTFEDITLDKYDGKRGEYSPLNTFTNGILNKFKFGTKKLLKDLSQTSVKFDLTFDSSDLGKCFDLVKRSFDLKVIQKKVETFGENVKKAIVHTLENISPINEMTNSLELKLNIPYAPISVTCELKTEASFSKSEDDIIAHANASATYYDNVFTSTGEATLQLGNLNGTVEYYTKCVFSNTAFLDDLKKNISVTIGDFLDSDIINKLKPSVDHDRPPQCVKFTFNDVLKFAFYTSLLPNYCRFAMTKGLPIETRLFSDVICQVADSSLIGKYATICVAPSPLLTVNRLISKMTPELYNKNFDKFIKDVQDSNNLFGSKIIKSATKYVDTAPDISKIKVNVSTKNSLIGKSLDITIKSTNDFPIQCFATKSLKKENSKFSILQFLTLENMILNPNEEKKINVGIFLTELKAGEAYPFYMQCFSLPNAIYRYETTGIFNPYTYYYDSSIETQDLVPIDVNVDCNKKENKLNPHCIKIRVDNFIEKLKTDIPEFIKNLENEAQKFKNMAEEAKLKILKNLNETLKKAIAEVEKSKENLKTFVEKSIETAKYLANRDCSIYASGETSDEGKTYKAGLYLECRESKRQILSQIMGTVKEQFQCSKIVESITTNISDDMEQNLKYILFLIDEITNNPDALNQTYNQVIYDLTNCLQEKFDEYWPKVEKYLKEKKSYLEQSIKSVKRDVSNIIMEALSNLVNVLHFEEIDGYLKQAKDEIEKNGLIVAENAKKINENIFNFLKKFNEFGTNYYNISGSMGVNVTVNPGQLDKSTDANIFISDLEDKGIKLLLHSNYMLRDKKAYALQTVVFDSPLISVNAKNEYENGALNTFVGITLYDKDGNEIAVSKISVDFRPQLLYNVKYYGNMKTCLFYNEAKGEFSSDGVKTELDVSIDGEKYIRCTPQHLTSFTIGSLDNSPSSKTGVIILIIVLCLIVLVVLIYAAIFLRKKFSNKVTSRDIESSIPNKGGINA